MTCNKYKAIGATCLWSSVETGGRRICCHRSNVTVSSSSAGQRLVTLAGNGLASHGATKNGIAQLLINKGFTHQSYSMCVIVVW